MKNHEHHHHEHQHEVKEQKHDQHKGHSSHRDHGAHGHVGHSMSGGNQGHHKMMIRDFKKRFFISTALTIPVLVFSPMIQEFFNYHVRLPGNAYVLFILSSVIYFYGGWPFIKGFFSELKDRSPGMMTLIAMAISVAYFYSTATVFGLRGMDFFWELATLIDIMLLGHWLEMKSVLGASKALELLVNMMPDRRRAYEFEYHYRGDKCTVVETIYHK